MTLPRGHHRPLDNARADPGKALSARAFIESFCRVPSAHGALVPLTIHRPFDEALTAWDAIGPTTGLPRYSRLAILWPKKTGKSLVDGALALHELVAGTEPDREIILTASALAQSLDIVFRSCVRFVRRHPWLTKHVRVLKTELTFTETLVDARTGGRSRMDHVLKSVAGRDAEHQHGANPSLVIFDELHALGDYELLEALAQSPTRRVSRIIYSSYAGLKVQAREGNPLWDLWQQARDGSDPHLFASLVTGPEAWRAAPWISERFIDSQRKAFAIVPSKFRRLYENTWATGDLGGFLSEEELRDAIDPSLAEATGAVPGCHGGLDLGLSRDWAAFVCTHVDGAGRLTVAAIRYWRGTKSRPVNLMHVEDQIADLAERAGLERLTIDQWQGALLAERLRQRLRRTDVRAIAVTPGILDTLATSLKGAFASRLIRIPNHPELIDQLENLQGVEQRRRDLVRFEAGKGSGAAGHDDLVFALSLSAEQLERQVGRTRLPSSFRACNHALSVPSYPMRRCFLFGGPDPGTGSRSCLECEGMIYVKQAYRDHLARGGEPMDIRTFKIQHVQNSDFVAARRANEWADHML